MLASLIALGAAATWPLLLQRVIDGTTQHKAYLDIIAPAIMCLLLILVEPVATGWRQRQIITIGCVIERHLSRRVSARLLRRLYGPTLQSSGEVLLTFSHIMRVRECLLGTLPSLVFGLCGAVIAIAIIGNIDMAMATAIVVAAGIAAYVGRRSITQFNLLSGQYFRMQARRQDIAGETSAALLSIKALGVEAARHKRWDAATGDHCAALAGISEHSRRFVLLGEICANLLTFGIVAFGCARTLAGTLTIGQLFAIQILASRAIMPIMSSTASMRQLNEAHRALCEIMSSLAAPTERSGPVASAGDIRRHGLQLVDASVQYAPGAKPALAGVSFALPGEGLFAIVGRNGSGKTTLLRALLALAPATGGEVLIGGLPVADQHPRKLRRLFGVVDQSPVLFEGTVAENLRITAPQAVDAELWKALDFADMAELFLKSDDGLAFKIEPGGRNLSGGQRQRLAVARAVLRSPAALILDEPTSALDAEAALHLETRLLTREAAPLVILVSHHMTATMKADRIFVLDEGQLVGEGRHTGLLATCPHYAALWRSYCRDISVREPDTV